MFFSRWETRFRKVSGRESRGWCAIAWGVLFLVCPAPPAARAEVIDKMVAVVEGHVITLSDLRQEREIRTRLGDKPENDDTALIRDMIDNYLIEKQSSDFPGVDVSPEEIDRELQKSPPQEGVPSPAIRAAIGRRLRMQKYFDLRFRQFIRPSDQDLQKYYDEVFVPEAKNRGLDPIPPLASITDAIRNNVVQEQINHDVDGWLEAIRARSNIEIFQ